MGTSRTPVRQGSVGDNGGHPVKTGVLSVGGGEKTGDPSEARGGPDRRRKEGILRVLPLFYSVPEVTQRRIALAIAQL